MQQTTANGGVITYSYNKSGYMTELVNKIGENTVSSFSYQYSLDGKQTAKTDKDGITTHYSYDQLDQLVGEKQTVKGTDDEGEEIDVETANISYSYDWFGNRTETVATGYPVYTKTCVYDDGNRLISETHTQDGETVTTTHSYDDNGNLMRSESSDGKVVTRNYNGFNWQTDYVSADVSLWFRYLPNGLRYSKQKRTDSTCTVTTHHWDGSDIVMDVSQNGTVKGRYLRGNGKLIAEDIAGSYSYYFFNAHGDVINRVNSDGVVLKTYKYDSFGNIINPATVGDPNDPIYVDQSPFGYAGEYLDKENGEIYLRARYYNSEYGRFVTEDPAKYGTNWYSYCDNNPVTMVDRTGLRPTTDGSEGSKDIADKYMIETYPKQYESVIESLPPIPEPPKPEPPKPSKPTQKSPSTPSYIKQYNPDHNEFEAPAIIQVVTSVAINTVTNYIFDGISNYVGSVAGEAARQAAISTNPISGMQLAPVSGNLPNFATNADDISRHIAKVTSGVTKVVGYATGGVLDYLFQVHSGEDEKDALIKTLLHLGVTIYVSTMGLSVLGSLFVASIGTYVIDLAYDNADTIKSYLSKSFSFA